jgi:Bacterial Ig domain
MFTASKIKVGVRAVALALAASSFSAHAVLERVGPVSTDPSGGGYPTWYQDTTGLAIEFGTPRTDSELAGGWVVLLPGDVNAIPEVFPTNFFDEHFYFKAGAVIGTRQAGGKALLVLAEEGAFAVGPVVAGDQITFARIRMVLNPLPVTGTYKFIHPYGEQLLEGNAGERIFYSDDTGVAAGNFTGSLRSRMGPWLLPSTVPGGAEMAALTATNPTPDTDPNHFGGVFTPTDYPNTGASYIADPARLGPVTGSSLPDFVDSSGALRNHNIFRIEGPAGSGIGSDPVTGVPVDWLETTDFGLNGRIYTGVIPGRVTVERASYSRNASARKLDVFATAVETTQGRLPAAPKPIPAASALSFFNAACAGTVDALGTIRPPFSAPVGATETPMVAQGALQWAQSSPAVIPSAVCVKDSSSRDAAGNLVAVFVPKVVTDEVTVTQAFYNPDAPNLTVAAFSSDSLLAPTLNVAYGTFLGNLTAGQIVVPGLIAPPADVVVQSNALGSSKYMVSTGFVGATQNIVAANDTFTLLMNSPSQTLAVLANDTNVAGGTVALTSLPTKGTAVVNPDGTVSFTPNLNASGTDAFTYTVTVGTRVSNVGLATLNITSVNLPPVAVNDSPSTVANFATPINVLANDTDLNGITDIVAAVNVTQPTPAGATTSVAGGIVTFLANAPGTYTFTYQAQDRGGLTSANTATVTVQVAAAEQVAITPPATYVTNKRRLVVTGTISPPANQTVTVEFIDGNAQPVPLVVGTAGTVTSVAGLWTLDTFVDLPPTATSVKATGAFGGVNAVGITPK